MPPPAPVMTTALRVATDNCARGVRGLARTLGTGESKLIEDIDAEEAEVNDDSLVIGVAAAMADCSGTVNGDAISILSQNSVTRRLCSTKSSCNSNAVSSGESCRASQCEGRKAC